LLGLLILAPTQAAAQNETITCEIGKLCTTRLDVARKYVIGGSCTAEGISPVAASVVCSSPTAAIVCHNGIGSCECDHKNQDVEYEVHVKIDCRNSD